MIRLRNYPMPHLLTLKRHKTSSTTNVVVKPGVSAPAYQPKIVESQKYETWELFNRFVADTSSPNPRFSMVLPPPNVTGTLHLGHALACTIQDVIVRHKRSTGHNVLWVPGIDHAGIATQGVVEKYLKTKREVTRHEIGREKFLQEVWNWKEKHGNDICNQLRSLGCSLDWSRQTFTMDKKHTHAVNTAFKELFKKGLLYRRKAPVNWCNALKSTVSDIEVDHIPINGPTEIAVYGYEKKVKFGLLYHFAYMLLDSDEHIVVATTTPETMLGDTAIAVHPMDERYTHLTGKRAWHPFRNVEIPIIFDERVDPRFGTGAVKVTPGHSKTDFELAKKFILPLLEVIDEDGMMKNAETFNEMKKYDCRTAVVEALDVLGLMKEIKPHCMTLPVCSRTGDIIEHLLKEQWFLSCSKMNKDALQLVERGQLAIEPEKFIKNWLDWTRDDRDWCISRQLWWGHQIPAYKCIAHRNIVWVAADSKEDAKVEASKILRTLPDMVKAERDPDVLDTWFSSAIYPFAALGWPNTGHSEDYTQFYPLDLMATGHDILGFWVHRMVILGLELTGKVPFKKVLLHGVICDGKGAKMSKSRGNVIDPLDVIHGISMDNLKDKAKEKNRNGLLSVAEMDKAILYYQNNFAATKGIPECGVDALRFTMLSQDIKSHFVNFDIAMCHANKLFGNKIWQSVRYTQMSYAKLQKLRRSEFDMSKKDLTYFDKWILSRLSVMVDKVNTTMAKYQFHLATKAIRDFMYNEFCDVYLEATKPGLDSKDSSMAFAHAHTLSTVLNTSLRCLSPFMVFLTEELIPKVPTFSNSIIHDFKDSHKKFYDYPQNKDFEKWRDTTMEMHVNRFLATISLVREMKGLYNISNKLKPAVVILTKNDALEKDIKISETVFLNLSRCSEVKFEESPHKQYISAVLDKNTEVKLELVDEDLDLAIFAAKAKLIKKIKILEESLSKLEAKFASHHYLTHAPKWAQANDREKLNAKKKELEALQRLM